MLNAHTARLTTISVKLLETEKKRETDAKSSKKPKVQSPTHPAESVGDAQVCIFDPNLLDKVPTPLLPQTMKEIPPKSTKPQRSHQAN